eukprot:8829136-Pyramimonas_sp.AAC.1
MGQLSMGERQLSPNRPEWSDRAAPEQVRPSDGESAGEEERVGVEALPSLSQVDTEVMDALPLVLHYTVLHSIAASFAGNLDALGGS